MRCTRTRILALALSLTLIMGALTAGAMAAGEEEEAPQPQRGSMTYSEAIAPRYEETQLFSEGLAAVRDGGKWGYIDTDGETVVPFDYDLAYPFSEGKAVVGTQAKQGWTLGFVDRQGAYTGFALGGGNYVLSEQEREAEKELCFYNGFVRLPGAEGGRLYDTVGAALNTSLTPTHTLTEGLAPGYSPAKTLVTGYFDKSGQTALSWEPEYFGGLILNADGQRVQSYRFISRVLPFNQDLAPLWQCTVDAANDWAATYRLGFIDRTGAWVIAPAYTNCFVTGADGAYEVFGETGLAMVQNETGRYGAINKIGQVFIPFEYEELWPFSEGLAAFRQNGVYGYLNSSAQPAIPAQFVKATGFSGGYAAVYDGSRAYLIDRRGKEVPGSDKLDPDTYFRELPDGSKAAYDPGEYVVIEEDGKYGFGHLSYLPPLPDFWEMDTWAFDEVVQALEADLIPVELQNLYRSDINRAEFCALAVRAVERCRGTDIAEVVRADTGRDLYDWVGAYPFSDVSDSDVIAAYALGIVTGRGNGRFDPYAAITRQEAAAFLARTAKVLGVDTAVTAASGFADSGDVEVWFTGAVDFVSARGIMGSTGENRFSPQGRYTREQSFVTLYRLVELVSGERT